jgi:hypothetical protein
MHAIEREIIEVTEIKLRKKFDNRQDYLGSLLEAANKLDDDDFESLTQEAADWYNAAVQAFNVKKDIPDFDETSGGPEDDEEAEEEADEEAEGDEADSDDDEVEAAEDAAPEENAEEAADDSGDEPKPVAPKAPAKKVAKAKEKAPPKKTITKATPKAAPKKAAKPADDEEVVLDKWGCMEGSKNSQALAMFEKGATAAEVKDAIGGTYYNVLKKMVKDGHKMDKEGHIIKLTHKDAAKAPSKKSKK